ncbi:hypothetical protein HanRHA438_Chr17g0835971 [Helianthus annuus]|nr:hypothetical protein HanRHA438_Chr17g0835971 [Helianthus annuus]
MWGLSFLKIPNFSCLSRRSVMRRKIGGGFHENIGFFEDFDLVCAFDFFNLNPFLF